MIVGSHASIYYGEPRFTQDIDIVVEMTAAALPALLGRFPPAAFYVSEEAVRAAIAECGRFNIVHGASGVKIDVFIGKDTGYDRARFGRRHRLPLVPGREAYFARAEDVILYKLLYFRQGGADRHLRDIAEILAVSGAHLDIEYTERDGAVDLALDDGRPFHVGGVGSFASGATVLAAGPVGSRAVASTATPAAAGRPVDAGRRWPSRHRGAPPASPCTPFVGECGGPAQHASR